MNFSFKDYLSEKLIGIKNELNILNCDIFVEDEQMFLPSKMDTKSIYVVIKQLSDTKESGIDVVPYQILIFSQQDALENTRIVFAAYAKKFSNSQDTVDGMLIKQSYSDPVVLSNFDQSRAGYRSTLYMNATLVIMENVLDVSKIEIDGSEIEFITASLSYAMTTDTQQTYDGNIASSTKQISTLSLALTVPSKICDFTDKVFEIINDDEDITGNEDFNIKITLTNAKVIQKNMKLVAATPQSANKNAPSLQLGFMR